MIDGKTQLVGLIGWPVEHSLSPAMHNAAFDELGLNYRYLPLPVTPGKAEEAVKGLAALGFRGANVTVPHKQAVIPALDVVAPEAEALGAVNTIVVERTEDGTVVLRGHNTDAPGFIRALRAEGYDPEGRSAIVVGAGGGARAVVCGLLSAGAKSVGVLDVVAERAQSLVDDLRGSAGSGGLSVLAASKSALARHAAACELLVNATPVGMWPDVETSIWPEGADLPGSLTVFDLVYNPRETKLLAKARESGARTIGGLGMLVEQGAAAFELWTGQAAPVVVMRAACERGLGR
jgi:shikimate dehydrogenase